MVNTSLDTSLDTCLDTQQNPQKMFMGSTTSTTKGDTGDGRCAAARPVEGVPSLRSPAENAASAAAALHGAAGSATWCGKI